LIVPGNPYLIRVLAVTAAVMVMLAGAVVLQTSTRFARSHNDRSVSNRLVIWKQTPRMMVDAPWGWGVGNAGAAYMGWYQPLENTEQYRTLVNSHLTWLVELGWPMRMLYVFGWAAVFVLCLNMKPQRTRRERGERGDAVQCSKRSASSAPSAVNHDVSLFCGVVCGMWTAFFVAAMFSSVAEVPWLWIPPGLGLAGVLAVRYRQRLWPSRLAWAGGAAAGALGLVTLAVCGYATDAPAGAGRFAVRRNGAICVGAQRPQTWIVVGTSTEGQAVLYETYRNYRAQQTHPPVGLAPSPAALPADLSGCALAVLGASGDWETLRTRAKMCETLLLIAPDAFPDELNLPEIPVRVVFGEFSNRPSAAAWRGTGLVETLEGVGDFFQDWPEIVFGGVE